MIKHYYMLLKQRLQAITDLKNVDLYLGQFDQDGKVTLPVFPVALIEFEPLSTSDYLQQVQHTEIEFSVYVVSQALWGDDRKILDDDVGHLDLCEAVYVSLHGYSAYLSAIPAFASLRGTNDDIKVINNLSRTGFEMIQTPNSNLYVSVLTFRGAYVDLAACKTLLPQLVNANITAQIV